MRIVKLTTSEIHRNFLCVSLFVFFFLGHLNLGLAQMSSEDKAIPINELKINAPLILAGFIELSYERQLNKYSSVGISTAMAFTDDYYSDFALVPHYRLYFGKRPVRGFYIEGNAAYYTFFRDESLRKDNAPGFGLGVAVGFKLINSNLIVADIFAGAGRNFSDNPYQGEAYPRLGICVGKKF